MKRPPALKEHDSAVILSPAGRIEAQYVTGAAALLRRWGLQPIVAPHALGSQGRYSGSVEERLADMQQVRCLGKPALVRHLYKSAQLFEFHVCDSVLEWMPV